MPKPSPSPLPTESPRGRPASERVSTGPSCPVEDIARAYLVSTQGDAEIALRCAITDARSDLMEAERKARENSRLISRGYVRRASFPC